MGEMAAGRTWHTWSGTARCTPAHLIQARREADIVDAVNLGVARDLTVRAGGTGHSFNALACTDGVLVDLTRYTGVVGFDPVAGTVEVRAGTTIAQVNRALARVGRALANVGTLTAQTVGGAISTGNHGSGLRHGPFSGQVVGLRLVTAAGELLVCESAPDPDVLRCARTGLGALGIISTVTLRCVPAFNLRVVRGSEPLDGLLERVQEWAGSAEHVAFNWLPWRGDVSIRSMDSTLDAPSPGALRRRYRPTLDEVRCGSLGLLARLRPGAVPAFGAGAGPPATRQYVDVSHHVFSFRQPVRFLALEHALPLEQLAPAVRALRGLLRRAGQYSPYSLLGRVGAADDSPLSLSYGRRTGYLNLTVPRSASYLELLRSCEHLLRDFDARPHWGKAHSATADLLRLRYPLWDTFQRVRSNLDPDGRFANDYVRRVLGPVRALAGARDAEA